MLKIYGLHTPNFFKTIWAAEELAINYQHVPVDLIKGETRSPEHKARHPFGKVPVIEHEGRFIFESNTTMRYMASVTETKMYPKDAYLRAQVDQWMDYFSMQAGRWCSNVWFEKVIGPQFFKTQTDQKMVDDFSTRLSNDMALIDNQLAKNSYIAGNEFTIADICAFCLMMGHKEAGFDFSNHKNFTRWFDSMKNRAAFKKLSAHHPTKNL